MVNSELIFTVHTLPTEVCQKNPYVHIHTGTHTHTYIYIKMSGSEDIT